MVLTTIMLYVSDSDNARSSWLILLSAGQQSSAHSLRSHDPLFSIYVGMIMLRDV